MSYPIRLEYINDGGVYLPRTGIDMKNVYTLTITPTYHFNDSAIVRVELSYVGADKQAFIDDNGATKNIKTSAALTGRCDILIHGGWDVRKSTKA